MEKNLQKILKENEELKARNAFLNDIIDNLPAIIYINQVDKIGDTSTMKNVWANKYYHDNINYTREEIDKMGFGFFEKIMHPDEWGYALSSIDYLGKLSDKDVFGGLGRTKAKGSTEYKWSNVSARIFKRKPDGTPWKFIGVGFPLKENIQTEKQFIDVIKENIQLINKLLIKCLSKREKEIIKLLAEGRNTHEISKELNLSEFTITTHRKNILKKLELHNTAALVNFAVENGLN